MKKYLFLLVALIVCLKTFGQTTPTSPTQLTLQGYKDNANRLWFWDQKTGKWYITPDSTYIQQKAVGALLFDNNFLTSGNNVHLANNLHIGTSTIPGWNAGYSVINMAGDVGIRSHTGAHDVMLFNNLYNTDGSQTWHYTNTGFGSYLYLDNGGGINFYSVPNGVAGSTVNITTPIFSVKPSGATITTLTDTATADRLVGINSATGKLYKVTVGGVGATSTDKGISGDGSLATPVILGGPAITKDIGVTLYNTSGPGSFTVKNVNGSNAGYQALNITNNSAGIVAIDSTLTPFAATSGATINANRGSVDINASRWTSASPTPQLTQAGLQANVNGTGAISTSNKSGFALYQNNGLSPKSSQAIVSKDYSANAVSANPFAKGIEVVDDLSSIGFIYKADYGTNQRLQRLAIPSVATSIALIDSVKGTLSSAYLPLTGGTITGDLTVNSPINGLTVTTTNGGTHTLNITGTTITNTTNNNNIFLASGNNNYAANQHTFYDMASPGNVYLTLGNGSNGPLSYAPHLQITGAPSQPNDVVRLTDLTPYLFTASNGITKTGSNFTLGGLLTKNTIIDGNNGSNSLTIQGTDTVRIKPYSSSSIVTIGDPAPNLPGENPHRLQVVSTSGYPTVSFGNYGLNAGFHGWAAGGTAAAPTKILNGLALFSFGFRGYGDTQLSPSSGSLTAYATEDFSDTTQGTRIQIQTNSKGHNANLGRDHTFYFGDDGLFQSDALYTVGAISQGITVQPNVNFYTNRNITGGITSYGFYNDVKVASDVTTEAVYYGARAQTLAASFTLPILSLYRATQGTFGTGSTVTVLNGFNATSSLIGGVNNYGFRGSIPAASNNWNLYMDGTAQNAIAGNVRIGSTAAPVSTLDVTGTLGVSSSITGASLNLSSSNAGILLTNTGSGSKQWSASTSGNDFRINEFGIAARMAFVAGGFVGVGYTADPTSGNKLGVNGNMYVNGTVTIPTAATSDSSHTAASTEYVKKNFAATTVYFTPGMFSGLGTAGSNYNWGTNTIPMSALAATGTASSSTYLRGDGAWVTVTSGFTNPMTTQGDLIKGGASGAATRVPIGGANQVLGVNTGATDVEYKTISGTNGVTFTPGSGTLAFSLDQSFAPTWTGVHAFATTNTASSGTGSVNYGTYLHHTVNQTSTAGFTDLLINRVNTAPGSGSQRLIDLQVNGSSVFNVNTSGGLTLSSGVTSNGIFTTSQFSTSSTFSSDGLYIYNNATASSTNHDLNSLRVRWMTPVWNTGTPAQNFAFIYNELRAKQGNPPTYSLYWSSNLSTTNTMGTGSDIMQLDNFGDLTLLNSIGTKRITGGTSTPAIAAGTGAGTTPTITFGSNSTDLSGNIKVTTGASPTGSNAIIATVTFTSSFANTSPFTAPHVVLTPANATTAALSSAQVCFVPGNGETNGVTTTTFTLVAGSTALAASTAYNWTYQVIQ